MACLGGRFQRADFGARAKAFGKYYPGNDYELGEGETAAVVSTCGKGTIGAVLLSLGKQYLENSTSVSRRFLQSLVNELFPDPIVRVR